VIKLLVYTQKWWRNPQTQNLTIVEVGNHPHKISSIIVHVIEVGSNNRKTKSLKLEKHVEDAKLNSKKM